jgi:hypothetical protein
MARGSRPQGRLLTPSRRANEKDGEGEGRDDPEGRRRDGTRRNLPPLGSVAGGRIAIKYRQAEHDHRERQRMSAHPRAGILPGCSASRPRAALSICGRRALVKASRSRLRSWIRRYVANINSYDTTYGSLGGVTRVPKAAGPWHQGGKGGSASGLLSPCRINRQHAVGRRGEMVVLIRRAGFRERFAPGPEEYVG